MSHARLFADGSYGTLLGCSDSKYTQNPFKLASNSSNNSADLLRLICRDELQEGEGEGQMQAELSKLADDLVQKFEDQWKATAENLDSASKAFDNLEGRAITCCIT